MPDRLQTPLAIHTALAVAALATTRLRVGSHVFANDLRHPALVAREVATLDALSGGRVELGLGAGVNPSDYQMLGLPFESPGTRVGRVEEAVAIMKALFTGEPVHFSGKHYTVTNLRVGVRPVQQPHPPIFIGSAHRRMLTLAAREADIVSPSLKLGPHGPDPTDVPLDEKVAWIRAAAGDRFDQLELSQPVFGIRLTDSAPAGATPGGGPPMPAQEMNTSEAVAHVEALRDRYGFSYFQIHLAQLENFAPVVAQLAGK